MDRYIPETILAHVKSNEFLVLKNMLVPLIKNIEQIQKRNKELILIQKEHSKQIERKTSQFENLLTEQDIRNELFSGSFFTDENNKNISLPHYSQPYYSHYFACCFLQTSAQHQITAHKQTHNFA